MHIWSIHIEGYTPLVNPPATTIEYMAGDCAKRLLNEGFVLTHAKLGNVKNVNTVLQPEPPEPPGGGGQDPG